jgi:hypothetical protein
MTGKTLIATAIARIRSAHKPTAVTPVERIANPLGSTMAIIGIALLACLFVSIPAGHVQQR